MMPVDDITHGTRMRGVRDTTELADSIAKVGLLQPIVATSSGRLVAGYHRLEACKSLGWSEIPAMVVDLSNLATELAEIDENLIRNELDVLERGEHLLRRKEIHEALHPETKHGGDRTQVADSATCSPRFSQDAATKTGVSERSVQTDVQIARDLSPDVKEVIRDTPLADRKDDLLKLSRMGEDEQRDVAGRVVSGGAKDVTKATQARAREQRVKAVEDAPPLPEGKFRCLVIDPPWPVQKIEREERPTQGVDLDYPVMTLAEIEALPVADLAAENGCHLYLWTTHKFLPDALRLVEAWGFRYQCLMTWVKPTGMTPYSWMYNTEHVIFARTGGLALSQMGLKLAFDAAVTRHSAKPDVFYERVIEATPGPRLEMFAREERDGLEAWGDDVTTDGDAS
jgi:N6-adenosine-specific RNA methylase IME4